MHILQTDWQGPYQRILKSIREQVFIDEQSVSPLIEWDEHDATAIHLLAMDNAELALGCARVLVHGRIGRMAVLKPYRKQGIGMALLEQAIAICTQKRLSHAYLSAQMQAIAFYERAGFIVTSTPHKDANIWHVDMMLKLI